MPAVKHMKWWGWGVEGVSFHHEDKPAFAAFVSEAIDIDVRSQPPAALKLEDLHIHAPKIGDDLRGRAERRGRRRQRGDDDLERIIHTYGKSVRDLIRLRAGDIPRVPDVVVYPADEAEVQAIVDLAVEADAVLIPFGGGSNISGSLQAPADETRTVDLPRPRPPEQGPRDRRGVRPRPDPGRHARPRHRGPAQPPSGWTLGHFPDSFTHSTLGGWVATRSSGMQSDKYGDIADITRGMRVVQPGRCSCSARCPAPSTGPSIREMILGSEGRLGVITEVTVQVHRIPENRLILATSSRAGRPGLAAMQEISTSDAPPVGDPGVRRERDPDVASPPARRARASRSPRPVGKGL